MKKLYYINYEKTISYNQETVTKRIAMNLSTDLLEADGRRLGIKKGDTLQVIAGKKLPIGTVGVVKYCGPNKYGRTVKSQLTGKVYHENPVILLTLPDDSEVWTTGNNCINITHKGVDGIHEFDSEDLAQEWIDSVES